MKLTYFPFYHSYESVIANLADSEVGRLVKALLKYSIAGETEQLNGRERSVYELMMNDIRRAHEEYEQKCSKLKDNSAKRFNSGNEERYQLISNEHQGKEKEKEKAISAVADNKTTAPTAKEIDEFCKNNGITGIDAQRFCDYYSIRGWKTKDGYDIHDWKALVRSWDRNNQQKPQNEHSFDLDEFVSLASKRSFMEET